MSGGPPRSQKARGPEVALGPADGQRDENLSVVISTLEPGFTMRGVLGAPEEGARRLLEGTINRQAVVERHHALLGERAAEHAARRRAALPVRVPRRLRGRAAAAVVHRLRRGGGRPRESALHVCVARAGQGVGERQGRRFARGREELCPPLILILFSYIFASSARPQARHGPRPARARLARAVFRGVPAAHVCRCSNHEAGNSPGRSISGGGSDRPNSEAYAHFWRRSFGSARCQPLRRAR